MITTTETDVQIQQFIQDLDIENFDHLQLSEGAQQVAVYISGYITHSLIKDISCADCLCRLKDDQVTNLYLNTLNRGGLNLPSKSLNSYVQTALCLIEEIQPTICSSGLPFSLLTCRILNSLCFNWATNFSCTAHKEHICKKVNCKVSNIFFLNLSKKISHTQRKQHVETFKSRQRQKM